MTAPIDTRPAVKLMRGIETGAFASDELHRLAEALDPVLLYFVVRYLRETNPASDRAASAVLERLVKLTRTFPGMVAKVKKGEGDPVVRWFTGAPTFGEFRGRGPALIDLVVAKLEA
jgi:hypothetical protein